MKTAGVGTATPSLSMLLQVHVYPLMEHLVGHDNVLEVEKQLLHIMVEITTTSFSSSCKVCKKKILLFVCFFTGETASFFSN